MKAALTRVTLALLLPKRGSQSQSGLPHVSKTLAITVEMCTNNNDDDNDVTANSITNSDIVKVVMTNKNSNGHNE